RWVCPMDPEVISDRPGSCPKCGMALEPETPAPVKTEWTCPMHPQIVRDQPGSCPICGMALEPRTVVHEEANPELTDMERRFRFSLIFTVPLFLLGMSDLLPGMPVQHALGRWLPFIELALATPVVLWAGSPFLVPGARRVAASVRGEGGEGDVPSSRVRVGDVLRVRPGEAVPVDGVGVEGNSTVDESMVTGESIPVAKQKRAKVTGAPVSGPGAFLM